MSTTNISVRMNDRDMKLLKEYAKLTEKSISVIVREAVIDKIEEDIDIQLFTRILF